MGLKLSRKNVEDSEFNTILRSLRTTLKTSLESSESITPLEAMSNLTEGQQEIWQRLSYILGDSELSQTHCERCREEYVSGVEAAVSLIDRYTSGFLTEPRMIWGVTFRSADGQHGFSKTFLTKNIPEQEGYSVDDVSSKIVFKEEMYLYT